MVEQRTRIPNGYRIVLAPAKLTRNDFWVLIPGKPRLTFTIPRSFVPHGSMLIGPIQVTADGKRVTAVAIL